MSIIGNASLITKVYVPKYIYPATKVISCSINLFISIIPLLIVTLLTGGKINLTLLLLPYALACLLVFCMGMVLLLSAANVFFQRCPIFMGDCQPGLDVCYTVILSGRNHSGKLAFYSDNKSHVSYYKFCSLYINLWSVAKSGALPFLFHGSDSYICNRRDCI